MSDSTTLRAGQIQFYDSLEPGLKEGQYRIDVSHRVDAPGASIPPVSQTFIVAGPRFAVGGAEVHARFPPPGAMGQFADTLPHIVLNKRLLPWERDVAGFAGEVPWMALLLFEDGELLGDPGGGDHARTMKVSELIANPDGPARKPRLSYLTSDELDSQCQVITIASSLFVQIAPTAAELPYLAHVRQVRTGDKIAIDMLQQGWFSVVAANRFPKPGTEVAAARNTAHLVSLEGLGDLLTGAAPIAPVNSRGQIQAQIQLVSLASWAFSCLADPSQSFSGLAGHLARDASGSPRPASSLLLRLPVEPPAADAAGPAAVARRRLADGYVALSYHARTGEGAFAWYRGPLAPALADPIAGAGHFASASAAMIFDPAYGLFDMSLAAAWQVGRGLALADQSFAAALMRLRLRAQRSLTRSMAPDLRARLAALFRSGLTSALEGASAAGPLPPPVRPEPAPPRPPPAQVLRRVLSLPGTHAMLRAQLDSDPDTRAVVDWLARLSLLIGVPFAHLVPDARMLPPESIRFFYVDPSWTGAMLDGAMSVGTGTGQESSVQAVLSGALLDRAAAAALAMRAGQLGVPAPAPASPRTGMVIRSQLVAGWPGIGVLATSAGAPVAMLRADRMASDVMLCLFNGAPDTVTLVEPHEGLRLGVDDEGRVVSRQVSGEIGAPVFRDSSRNPVVYDSSTQTSPGELLRPGGTRTLNISTGGGDLISTLKAPLGHPASFGPADFAIQMVKAPEQVSFSTQATGAQ